MEVDEVLIIAAVDASPVIKIVLERLHELWPGVVCCAGDHEGDFFTSPTHLDRRLKPFIGDVMVAPTQDICDRWDDEGYFVTPEGLGPLMWIYSPCTYGSSLAPVTNGILAAFQMDNDFDVRRPPRWGDDTEYEAHLCHAGLSSLTLVTPEDADTMRETLHRTLEESMAQYTDSLFASKIAP